MSDKTKHYSVSRAQWNHFGFHAVHSSRHQPVNQNGETEIIDSEQDGVRTAQPEMVVEDA